MSKRAKKNKNKTQTIMGVFLMLVVVSALAAGAFYFNSVKVSNHRDANGCLDNSAINTSIILFDKSDALNDVQKKSIRLQFDNLILNAAVNTRFMIYLLDANNIGVTSKLVTRCKPKTASEANFLTDNERLIEKRWTETFIEPLDQALEQLLKDNPSKSSPIMEAIQNLSFDIQSIRENGNLIKLYIVSDMIQNTDSLNQYTNNKTFDEFSNSPYFNQVRSDLSGAEVEILYVGRTDRESIQTNRHGIFWSSYFQTMNGRLTKIERILGE